MFPPFDEHPAYEECVALADDIKTSRVKLLHVAKTPQNRKISGVMLGCALAVFEDGRRVFLKTVSGSAFVLSCENPLSDEVFVPSVVSQSAIESALKKNDFEIHSLTEKINDLKSFPQKKDERIELEKKRKALTDESFMSYVELFSFCGADKKMHPLKEMLPLKNKILPPAGTGECCAPKLLHYAFSHGSKVLSMCEIFYSMDKTSSENHLKPFAPCDSRCAIILPHILGLEIIYRDEHICVVNKPSGLLSIPGRGPEKIDSLTYRLKRLFPSCIEQPAVHRLDMETSGLVVMAFTKEAHRILSRQFEDGVVHKEYEALLDGVLLKKNIAPKGMMELYFRLDVDNRPHQMWDSVNGKKAVTQWTVLNVESYTSPAGIKKSVTRVLFEPLTGRTHQLRISSSDPHGFGVPIVGDTLYGTCEKGERLCLHARRLSFIHPITQKNMDFFNPCPF